MKNKKSLSKKNIYIGIVLAIYSMILLFIIVDSAVGTINHEGVNFFRFFTNQSNILCLIWFIFIVISCFWNNNKFKSFATNRIVMTSVTTYISITFFVVLFWLLPFWKGEWLGVGLGGAMVFTHFLTPIVTWILYFLLIDSSKSYNWKWMFLVLTYVLFWVVCEEIEQACGLKATYPFVDYKSYLHSFGNVGGICLFLGIAIALFVVFYFFSFGINKLKNVIQKKLL